MFGSNIDKMARLARKQMADMRAVEEEHERVNPVNPKKQLGTRKGYTGIVRGGGATPSMGLSQHRGGARRRMSVESGEDLEGGGFLSDLGIPIISNLAGAIGLGSGEYEGGAMLGQDGHGQRVVGAGTKKGQMRKTARRAYESGNMSEATQMGLHLGKHLHSLHGAGFWDDFKKGFNMVVSPVAGIAKSVLPMLGPEGAAASGVIGALGYGKHGKRGCGTGAGKLTITHGGGTGAGTGAGDLEGSGFLSDLGIPIVSQLAGAIGLGSGATEGKGRRRKTHGGDMMGYGTGAGTGAGEMEGGGFLSDLGIPIISNLAGAIGLGKKKRRAAGPNDGRRKRAEVVRKVMREKGMSMIEASKYVKQHGLY